VDAPDSVTFIRLHDGLEIVVHKEAGVLRVQSFRVPRASSIAIGPFQDPSEGMRGKRFDVVDDVIAALRHELGAPASRFGHLHPAHRREDDDREPAVETEPARMQRR